MAFGTGGVDGCVEATEAGDRPVNQLAQFVIVAHVGPNELGLRAESPQLRGQCLSGFLVAARDSDPAAFLCESQSRCAADACQSARNQDDCMFHRCSFGPPLALTVRRLKFPRASGNRFGFPSRL